MKRCARVDLRLRPEDKVRWESRAEDLEIDLTSLIEAAMERFLVQKSFVKLRRRR